MASETDIECAILAADGTYNAMGLHAQELGRIIRELEAERDQLKADVYNLRSSRDFYKSARDELITERDALEEKLYLMDAVTTARRKRYGQIPRIITAKELKVGQLIVAFDANDYVEFYSGVVHTFDDYEFGTEITFGSRKYSTLIAPELTIVLLADAPPQEPEPKRLTVEDLDAAEVGSKAISPNGDASVTKNESGSWLGISSATVATWEGWTLTPPEKPEPASIPCTFILVRDEDETGVSGIGRVAEGVIYSDGHVSLRWVVGEHRSTVAYDSVEAVEAIHGHGGKTRVVPAGQEE